MDLWTKKYNSESSIPCTVNFNGLSVPVNVSWVCVYLDILLWDNLFFQRDFSSILIQCKYLLWYTHFVWKCELSYLRLNIWDKILHHSYEEIEHTSLLWWAGWLPAEPHKEYNELWAKTD